MIIFPAIDLFDGKAVRLFKGDYNQMTIYSDNPVMVADDFLKKGATHVHLVDLAGAKDGTTPNFETVCKIKSHTNLFCEVGGGIRSIEVIDQYIRAGLDRVILGTAAVMDPKFVQKAVEKYGDKIAIGMDIKDNFVAVKGWTESSARTPFDFCLEMQNIGVKTIICTDISKDGAMSGTNHTLYNQLSEQFHMQIIASGGVSSIEDVKKLSDQKIYGAIIGKAYYTNAIDLKEAIEVAK